MKYRRLALLVFASASVLLRAQDDDRKSRPPTEIPDFSNLDEYIYEPKSSVQLSFRHLSSSKTTFSGRGTILAPEGTLPGAGANLNRNYHDGYVDADTRTAPRSDSAGNPVLDPSTGAAIQEPIAPDGRTNSWKYVDSRQVNNEGENPGVPMGFVAFHSYSADVFTDVPEKGATKSTNGLDLAVTHDMGKFFGGRVSWSVIAGMSINDIDARSEGGVSADVKTLTDYYSTFGQKVPAPIFTSPGTTAILINNAPVYSTTTVDKANKVDVVNTWKLKGAYYTFRAGPVLSFPFLGKFHVDISAGPALIYAGTTYRVTQTFTPDTGDAIIEADSRAAYKFRPGMYADASLAYDLTDKAGFFAGAIWQTTKGYTQALHSTTANYAAKVDLENQSGLRAGMSVRF